MKSLKSLGLQSPNRYEVLLSNEVVNIGFGKGVAKISDVKVRGRKNFCQLSRPLALGFEPATAIFKILPGF